MGVYFLLLSPRALLSRVCETTRLSLGGGSLLLLTLGPLAGLALKGTVSRICTSSSLRGNTKPLSGRLGDVIEYTFSLGAVWDTLTGGGTTMCAKHESQTQKQFYPRYRYEGVNVDPKKTRVDAD